MHFFIKRVILALEDGLQGNADVFHCESVEKMATEFLEEAQMTAGNFDNVRNCKYTVSGY